MDYAQIETQTTEREYTESLAVYSLQGLMAARKQHFVAAHRRMYPSNGLLDVHAPEPLARSTIRSPAHAAAAAGVAARVRAGAANRTTTCAHADANIYDAVPAVRGEGTHPRRAGRNGTPKPSITHLQPLAPLLPSISSDDLKSPTCDYASANSPSGEAVSCLQHIQSTGGSSSSEGYGDARQRGLEQQRRVDEKINREAAASALLDKCAEPTCSIGLPRRTA